MKVVAIATIADAAPLTGENRVFASLGLDALRRAVNPGLKALLEVAQISPKRPPTSGEVGFRIAPRINAAGRMDVARDVIELFSVKDAARARELAAKLDRSTPSARRKNGESCARWKSASPANPALCEAYCIVVDGEGWHRGVIGITATRVVERYNRPAVVISRDGDEAFGSGRSIRAFHLLEAIESCGDLFSRYGGHSHACGFAMPSANVAELRAKLDAFARARLTPADFDPMLDLDAELDLDEVTPELFQALRLLEPYGMGNPEPSLRRPRRAVDRASANPERQARQAETKGGRNRATHIVAGESEELSAAAVLATPALPSRPRRHPARPKSSRRGRRLRKRRPPRTENRELRTESWRNQHRLRRPGLAHGRAPAAVAAARRRHRRHRLHHRPQRPPRIRRPGTLAARLQSDYSEQTPANQAPHRSKRGPAQLSPALRT